VFGRSDVQIDAVVARAIEKLAISGLTRARACRGGTREAVKNQRSYRLSDALREPGTLCRVKDSGGPLEDPGRRRNRVIARSHQANALVPGPVFTASHATSSKVSGHTRLIRLSESIVEIINQFLKAGASHCFGSLVFFTHLNRAANARKNTALPVL
jgi:hypothetical protein